MIMPLSHYARLLRLSHRPLSLRSCRNLPRTSSGPKISSSGELGSRRPYYTQGSRPDAAFPPAETAILSSAISHVPNHGFSRQAMLLGAQDAGYIPASLALFPSGSFDLVKFHLITQRLALKDNVQFPRTSDSGANKTASPKPIGVAAKIRLLSLTRLRANASVIHRYQEAIALMSLASNISTSVAELGRLADEIWYLAGDTSVDSSWYSKRGALAGVYAATEVFMTQDKSEGFAETENFLDRRLDDVRRLGPATWGLGRWLGFTGTSTVNVLRSWGARI